MALVPVRLVCRFVLRAGVAALVLLLVLSPALAGADPPAPATATATVKPQKRGGSSDRPAPRLKLSDAQAQEMNRVVDKGLAFLASKQNEDGSFPTVRGAEPAVTGLCVMAFLLRGYVPGKAPYGEQIERGVDYLLHLQDAKTGALFQAGPGWPRRGNYNHAISALALCDVFVEMKGTYREVEDQARPPRARSRRRFGRRLSTPARIKLAHGSRACSRCVAVLAAAPPNDADLSVTAWMVMFYSAAKKIGFQVPKKGMADALKYVRRSFDKKQRGFVYALAGDERYCSRATVGAGIMCLILGDDAANPTIPQAADWIYRHSFEPYNGSMHPEDRYHYSAFYCSQAMALLGGKNFEAFYPKLLLTLSHHQHEDGSWDREAVADGMYGNVYTTALALLALSPPYEKLASHVRGR